MVQPLNIYDKRVENVFDLLLIETTDLTEEELLNTIKSHKNTKATGLNGIPEEVWTTFSINKQLLQTSSRAYQGEAQKIWLPGYGCQYYFRKKFQLFLKFSVESYSFPPNFLTIYTYYFIISLERYGASESCEPISGCSKFLVSEKKPNVKSNYRPISPRPFFGNVLEKLIYDSLYSHLISCNSLNPNQPGFHPCDSAINQDISITHTIFIAYDCNPSLDVRSI